MNLELEQQRVLVVGAAGTIGKAVTQAFLQEGCSVISWTRISSKARTFLMHLSGFMRFKEMSVGLKI